MKYSSHVTLRLILKLLRISHSHSCLIDFSIFFVLYFLDLRASDFQATAEGRCTLSPWFTPRERDKLQENNQRFRQKRL